MKWSSVLWGMILSTLVALCSWGAVLFFVNPESATLFEWSLFSATLFLSLAGLCSIFLFLFHCLIFGGERTLSRIGRVVREGVFLAIFCMGSLFLFRAGWLVWWDALFLFGFLFLVELFFLRKFRTQKEAEKRK